MRRDRLSDQQFNYGSHPKQAAKLRVLYLGDKSAGQGSRVPCLKGFAGMKCI
jgi:hypothetical protein